MEHTAEKHAISAGELDELTVRCLLLPLYNMSLLVPNTMVAEVTDYRPPEIAGHMPEWMPGVISWRGKNIPVISFEHIIGHEVAFRSEERRYVICNTLSGNNRIPFIALEVQGIPHLVQVTNRELEKDNENQQSEPAILANLRLNEESVIVPNIDVMEKMLEHLGIAAI